MWSILFGARKTTTFEDESWSMAVAGVFVLCLIFCKACFSLPPLSLFGLFVHMAVGNESAYSWLVPTSEVTVVVVADCVGTSCVVFR